MYLEVGKPIIFLSIFLSALTLFIRSILRLLSYLKIAGAEDRYDNILRRIRNVLVIAIGQFKLFRYPFAGILHALIFWGFLLLLFAVAESILQGFYAKFSFNFLGIFYSSMTLTQDVFGSIVLTAVPISAYRRFVIKVKRLSVDTHGKKDAAVILSLIFLVVLTMFLQNISHVAILKNNLEVNELRPVSLFFSSIIYGAIPNTNTASIVFEIFWWAHVLLILGFANYLPYSKHLHVLTSIPNVFFGNLYGNRTEIKPIDFNDESLETYGVKDIEKLTWKQMLDGYSCTECGRCTAVCPAANSGKSLSPRKIITDIRERTFEKAPLIIAGVTEGELFEKTLVPNLTSEKELWQCTTCNACIQECPVMIEHVPAIIDMRRYLVLSDSNFPPELNNTFRNMETNFTPWAFSPVERADWAEGLSIKSMSEDPECDYLFWVGCAGSYDNRYKKVSVAFSKLMQKGGINFRILGIEEKCNGDTARRLGNEYLAQELVKQNVETLNNYNVKKIVTACPHCYNSLKKEFKQFGGNYEVIHHTQLISEMLKDGRLKINKEIANKKITYHDSCYLGRYNDVYEAPRNILSAVNTSSPIEMKRNRSNGLCCGAGGGQMFLEDNEGERINNVRTLEALATGAKTISTACPFCLTMMSDGIKAAEKTDEVEVKDVAEIVLENIT